VRGSKPAQVIVSDCQRAILEQYTRATNKAASLVERARNILLTASGMPTLRVADELGVDRQRARRWRSRWALELRTQLDAVETVANDKVLEMAIRKALMDAPRPGAPPQFTEDQVKMVCAMACRNPSEYGLRHAQWTGGLLARIAAEKGIVASVSVAEIGRWLKRGSNTPPMPVLDAAADR
jgi:putative transposase